MLWHIDFWIKRNRANTTGFHDGRYWTYNTSKAFSVIFPFWNGQKIARILRGLEDSGVVLSGNYNSTPFDRTKWYTIDYEVFESLMGKIAFADNENSHCSNLKNGINQTEKCITYINTNIETDNKQIEVETRDARPPQITPKNPKRVSRNKSFEDSEIARWEDFEKTFGTDEYAGADIRHYYDTIKDWATAKGAKYIDWIAFVRNWMRRDFKDGKLVRVGGFNSLEQWKKDMILRDRANDAEELWPDL